MQTVKIAQIVGTRPEFIKLAPVSRAIKHFNTQCKRVTIKDVLIHTGQHYDYNMSQLFFDELQIPRPKYNLDVGSCPHGAQTGRILERLESVLMHIRPSWVIVYGDTNSTLAGALAATKLHIPVAHIEAGLRSFAKEMPEEINRVITDHISSMLFAPTQAAVDNLRREGLARNVELVGDVNYDATLYNYELAKIKSTIFEHLDLEIKRFYLVTVHRESNTDNVENLLNILNALNHLDQTIVFTVHPRTRKIINRLVRAKRIQISPKVKLIEPVGYLDMLILEKHAYKILTDSGGVQKEAYFFGVPCITLREETEWIETVQSGWNMLVGTDPQRILRSAQAPWLERERPFHYGRGDAAQKIVEHLVKGL